jgi:hypothetical protein
MKTTFRQEKGKYLRTEALLKENVTEIRNTTETLNQTGGALDESVLEDVDSSWTVVRNIDDDWTTLDSDHTDGLTRLLYDAAWEDSDSSGELRTMRGVLNRTRDTESNVTTALERYRAELKQTERSLWSSVLVDVGIGLLPGLLVGGLLGAWYPHREAKRVAYDRQYSTVDYNWRTLIAPLVASLVVGVATLMMIGLVDIKWLRYLLEALL